MTANSSNQFHPAYNLFPLANSSVSIQSDANGLTSIKFNPENVEINDILFIALAYTQNEKKEICKAAKGENVSPRFRRLFEKFIK